MLLNELIEEVLRRTRRGETPHNAARRVITSHWSTLWDNLSEDDLKNLITVGLANKAEDKKRKQDGSNIRRQTQGLKEILAPNMDNVRYAHNLLVQKGACAGCKNIIYCVHYWLRVEVSQLSEREISDLVTIKSTEHQSRRSIQARAEELVARDRVIRRRSEIDLILADMFQEAWEAANGEFKNPLDFTVEDHIFQKEHSLKSIVGHNNKVDWHDRSIELLTSESKNTIKELSIDGKNRFRVFTITLLGTSNRGCVPSH